MEDNKQQRATVVDPKSVFYGIMGTVVERDEKFVVVKFGNGLQTPLTYRAEQVELTEQAELASLAEQVELIAKNFK